MVSHGGAGEDEGCWLLVYSEKRLFNHLEEHSAFTYCPLGKQDGGLPAVSLGDGIDMTGRWV